MDRKEEDMVNDPPKEGDTYRTECKRGRATYRPDWGSERPWVVYVDGTAMAHAVSLQGAKIALKKYGCRVR
jgi:hypothetical protein